VDLTDVEREVGELPTSKESWLVGHQPVKKEHDIENFLLKN